MNNEKCPRCASQAPADAASCAVCGMMLGAPGVAELRWIDGELARVEKTRAWLIHRRMVLLAELAQLSQTQRGTQSAPATVAQSRPANSPPARTELSGRAIARILLATGAVLVVIAAAVFTVANWSTIGPLGRSAVLLGVSAITLVVPVPLTRRGLAATAEAVAAVGLALTIGDAYLIARLLQLTPGGNPFEVAAGTAMLTGAWAAYGRISRLRGPWIAAIGLAQFPGLYLIDGLVREFGGPVYPVAGPVAVGLVLIAGADVFLGGRVHERGRRAEALTSSLLGVTAWISGIAVAGMIVAAGAGLANSAWSAVAFAGAAVAGLVLVPENGLLAPAVILVAPASGMALAGLAAPIASAVPHGWGVVAYAGVSGTVIAAARLAGGLRADAESKARPGVRRDLAAAGAAIVLVITVLYVLPNVLLALFQPYPVTSHLTASTAGWPTLAVLALAAVACWLVRDWHRSVSESALIAVAAGAVAALPVALHLTEAGAWARLGILTAGVACLTAVALRPAAQPEAGQAPSQPLTSVLAALVLAASATGWSLTSPATTSPATTVAELAALALIFTVGAVLAKPAFAAATFTLAALAAAAGLAFAAPAAAGWPARQAAYVVVAVAMLAVLAATRSGRVQALVLDAGSVPVVLAAAVAAAGQAGSFAMVAALTALTASAAVWLRTGQRRSIALVATGVAIAAAVAAQIRPLSGAWFSPVTEAWHGHPVLGAGPGQPSESSTVAAAVLTICLAAAIAAAGAAGSSRASSLDALAIAVPLVLVPAALAGGAGYPLVFASLLLVALALTFWAALRASLAPASGATVATLLAVDWALASKAATLTGLSCLAAAYGLCAWRATRPRGRAATASLTVLAAAGVVAAAVLASGRPGWEAGVAVLGVAAAALLTAARLPEPAVQERPVVALAVEAAAWLTALAGTAACLHRPATASLAIAISGLLAVGSALRPDRRPALWAGLVLLEIAWCTWLASAGITAIEAYTVPAGAIAVAFGWQAERERPELSSWLAYGPGLALALLPSLGAAWQDDGWVRPMLLGLGAAGVTLAGARLRLQAPLLTGAAVAALDAGRELAPEVRSLTQALPGWVPIALIGAVLIWAGATYEARLRNLAKLRRLLSALG